MRDLIRASNTSIIKCTINRVYSTYLIECIQPKVKFLGHVVGCHGVAKTRGYIDKVDNFPQPEILDN
jgi:hypothetical protein